MCLECLEPSADLKELERAPYYYSLFHCTCLCQVMDIYFVEMRREGVLFLYCKACKHKIKVNLITNFEKEE
jgi:hypothetical protein